jgi:type VI secretion system secreted protein VgrG
MTSPLTVTTPLGPGALHVAGMAGSDPISQLFRFELDLLAVNSQPVPFEQVVGQPITVDLALPGGGHRFVNGICSRFSAGRRSATFTAFRAQVVPKLWLLTRKRDSRIFQNLSVPDILERVLAGVDTTFELQGTYQPRNYCVQYRETDFDFASRLMQEEGIFYLFRHSKDGHEMVVADSRASNTPVPGPNPVLFAPVAPSTPGTRTVFDWDKSQELRSGKVTLWDHQFELPDSHLEGTAAIQESVRAGTVVHRLHLAGNEGLELFDYPGGYAKRFDGIDGGGGGQPDELQKVLPDATRTARIRMQQEAVQSLLVEGMSNCRHFTGGYQFTLSRHFDADGAYLLTDVEHSASVQGDPRKATQDDVQYHNRFTCIPLTLPFRPQRVTPVPVVPGPQTAIVVGPAGQQVFTDRYGRIKVQFHWDREGKSDEDSSCWVRVGALHAGEETGFHAVPEVGDEVVVAFLEGDPDQPIVVGSLYNDRRPPPGRSSGN